MKTKKIIPIMIVFTFIVLSVINLSQAYILYCLSDGEQLPPNCVGDDCRYTCDLRSGSGFCQICTTDSGIPGVNPLSCIEETCSFIDGSNDEGGVDLNPPILTINEPLNNDLFGSKRVLFDIDIDSKSRLEYRFTNETRWHKLCSACSDYSRHVRLDEGRNDLTIRAKKLSNNLIVETEITIFVDSKDPDFRDSFPDDGEFANGEFIVEYTEENLNNILMHYRGIFESNFNTMQIDNCSSGNRVKCSANISLSSYENSEVDYYFEVCDASQCDSGPIKRVKVDSTSPIIILNNPLNTLYSERKVLFEIIVNELVEIYYEDNNDGRDPHKKKRLCNGCFSLSKLMSLSDGDRDLTIYAEDEAGNKDSRDINFVVDTKAPRIRKTEPRSGYIGSPFFIEFREDNPVSLLLNYGNLLTGFRQQNADLNSCTIDRGRHKCTTNVNLQDYDNQEIEYWFDLTDIVGNNVQSNNIELTVDETFPEISSISYNIDGNSVELFVYITEINFEEATYIDNSDSRPREKRLCSRLDEGICSRKLTLREGTHDLTISVSDIVGHKVGQNVVIDI
jgi:hypothetical protein